MAKISNFIYCMNSITTEQDSSLHGVVSALTPDYIPGAFSFSIFCSIIDLSEGNHDIELIFADPNGNELVRLQGPIPMQFDQASNLPQEYMGVNLSSNWQNVVFKEEGLYRTSVKVDGHLCGVYEIYVKGKNQ